MSSLAFAGLAFAALYTTLSIRRRSGGGTAAQSDAVAAVVLGRDDDAVRAAQSFSQLFLARLGVGVGEARRMPPAHSMISDL